MLDEHPAEGPKSALDRLSDTAANFTSKPPILILVGVLAVSWVVGHFIFPPSFTQILIDVFEMLTLTLVVILQNSERRAEGALNKKLDLQAEALALLIEEREPAIATRLRQSVELEDKQ
ncbi:MAG: hypothetical protein QOG62_1561 [Thermoleophilaceae bacterium]|jgi:low affinity Fe/Cu permease|nr:hypothetical protein [Thermoleophilaceae bacterium]